MREIKTRKPTKELKGPPSCQRTNNAVESFHAALCDVHCLLGTTDSNATVGSEDLRFNVVRRSS